MRSIQFKYTIKINKQRRFNSLINKRFVSHQNQKRKEKRKKCRGIKILTKRQQP